MIYLDNSATTPLADEVAVRMELWRGESFANASSVHRGGQRARVTMEDARTVIALSLGAEPKEIVFTSGGTESNNLAIKGYALKQKIQRDIWPVIFLPRTEHHAVLGPAEFLEQLGATVVYIEVDRDGRVTVETLTAALNEAIQDIPFAVPPLVSIMHANNETGTINPITELSAVVHDAGGVFHSDAVQSYGKIPFTAKELGVDMLSISAHKIHGPKGVGALYINREIEIEPQIHGGSQERNRRGGTEPTELIVGFEVAARLAMQGMEENNQRLIELRNRLLGGLHLIDRLEVVTPEHEALPNIVNITFADAADLDGEALIVGMDLEGIAVSNGSACTSGSLQPSHVLLAMGRPPEQAKAAVRFSTSRYTEDAEIDRAVEGLGRVVEQMRKQRANS